MRVRDHMQGALLSLSRTTHHRQVWVTGLALCPACHVLSVSPGSRPLSCLPGSLVTGRVALPSDGSREGREGAVLSAEVRGAWPVPRHRCWASSPSGRSRTGPPSSASPPSAAGCFFCFSLFTSHGEEESHHEVTSEPVASPLP